MGVLCVDWCSHLNGVITKARRAAFARSAVLSLHSQLRNILMIKLKRNVTKEIKTIARERVGRVKAGKVIVPKIKKNRKRQKTLNELIAYNQEIEI